MMISRSYSELEKLKSFYDRFEYLRIGGRVGRETFGSDRYLNQNFYRSRTWKSVRNLVIARDGGWDLGVEGFHVTGPIYVHHMNPLEVDTILHDIETALNPEYLITVSMNTHNAIHYGDASLLPKDPVIRRPNDTIPWKMGVV